MNYNAKMLEHKTFNFLKQLLYSSALVICIMLIIAFVIVHFLNCAIYVVISDSQKPVFESGDLVVVKPQPEYFVGDVIKFQDEETGLQITHRIIGIKEQNDIKYFICHGDNEKSVTKAVANDENLPNLIAWQQDCAFVETLSMEELKLYAHEVVQIVTSSQIEGKVVSSVKGIGKYFTFIKNNYLYIILAILFVWKFVEIVEIYFEINRHYRLTN